MGSSGDVPRGSHSSIAVVRITYAEGVNPVIHGVNHRVNRHVGRQGEGATITIQRGSLLQEVVERPTLRTLKDGKYRSVPKQILRYGEVLIYVGNVVHVLVPHLTCRCPFPFGRPEQGQLVVRHRHNLGMAIGVHVDHQGVVHVCGLR